MTNLAEKTKFSVFCELLEKMRKTPQEINRKKEFDKFFRQLEQGIEYHDGAMLPFLRILLSSLDSKRRFNIKHKKLAQRVGKLLSVSAKDLLKYDTFGAMKTVECLASEVSSRISRKGDGLSVQKVNDLLDKMCSKEDKHPDDADFEFLFFSCSEKELVWIFNVMIRNVESYIGASSSSLLSLLGEEARNRWQLSRELTLVLNEEAVQQSDALLGRNFRPMLLARLSRQTDWFETISFACGESFFVELKYDGEHVLLHKYNKDNYKYFTRNGKDFSSNYGENSHEGSVSERIHPFFKDSLTDCILDCELVLWDKVTRKFCRHGRAASDNTLYSFRYVREESTVQIAVVLFDLLYYNGRSLLNVPLYDRLKLLDKGVLRKESPDTVSIAPRHTMSTREEVDTFFSAAMQADEEGIVVKKRDVLYHPGSRAKSNGCFKLKPNLSSSASLDLAIVAILPGRGREGATAYWLGAKDHERGGEWMRVVGQVSSGLSQMERDSIWSESTRDGPLCRLPPEHLVAHPIEPPGGFVPQEKMPVVEVVCTGVQDGQLVHPVISFLREKPVDEIDSTQTFKELSQALLNCHLPSASDLPQEKSKKRVLKKDVTDLPVLPPVIPKKKKEEDNDGSGNTPGQLSERTVCVLQGTDANLRKEAFRILGKHGAIVTANPVDGKTELVIALSRTHPKTKFAKETLTCPIIDVQWLLRSDKSEKLDYWKKDEIISEGMNEFFLPP